ncbi:MAG: aspartate aminotransferase family protein [Myxococcota bacterium]
MPNSTLADLDRASWLHPFSSLAEQAARDPLVIVEGRDTRVRDASGRWYLDAMAGLWCVNAGYGRREIADAMAEQAGRLAYYHGFAGAVTEPAVRLAAKLIELAPAPMARVFFASSGSEANDTQIKLIWQYNNLRGKPAKKKLIARRRGYHGSTVAAASLTGLGYVHAGFDLPLHGFAHVSPAHWPSESQSGESEQAYATRLARELEETIAREGPDTVAAFFAEPVMGAGGVLVPPASYFAAIQPVLRRHDVLLVADEVICGFGRLGRWFGSQRFEVAPDLLTIAKGLTSGYAPLSACLVSEPIVDVLRAGSASLGAFSHGYTYSGHPVAAAAALANLAIFEREGLIERADRTGELLQRRLRESCAGHPKVRDVRGVGMIAAVEPSDPEDAKRLQALLLADGVITRAVGGAVAMSPPLTLGEAEVEELVGALRRAVDKLA